MMQRLSSTCRPYAAGSPPQGIAWRFLAAADDRVVAFPIGNAAVELVRSAKLSRLEAVLFVAPEALSLRKLMQFATLADVTEARQLVEQLQRAYERSGSAFIVEQVASGFRLMTRPQYAVWLGKLHQRQAELKLTPPALETLAIIAYRQPITRADIEVIRGVQCTDMLKQLMDRNLVRIGGEETSLGRPFLYETSRLFLELFGLKGLDDLPMASALRKLPERPATTSEAAEQAA